MKRKKPSLFGSLFSYDAFKPFFDALFASGEALRYAKRQEALQAQIGTLLGENIRGVTPEKHAENTEKIEALLAELKR